MTRARNRCLPMNLRAEDLAGGVLRDRVKVGASLADVDPMNLDTSVRFDNVGGLGPHIQALKEMVVFPLLYPEVFEKFKIQPPRGCLFYGPPGTGKTLVARALANECSQGDRKVSFFMRKGADCLSKWVGESERQLRLLFDQAYLMRPSIIFFDEIDGLAPVRSSRQDQIHSSIVEFLFNLPDKKARRHILQIHTREWTPPLAPPFLGELAEKCVGYCGADIKALCTEAALMALRRRYPQIYGSSQKLRLDVESIVLGRQDFQRAMRRIIPASQRALLSPGHALAPELRPLLQRMLTDLQDRLLRVFPHAELPHDDQLLEDLLCSDDEDNSAPSIYDLVQSGSPKKQASDTASKPFLHFTLAACRQPSAFRPRLLLAGEAGSGQSTHLGPALLHHLEKLPVHRLDLPTLYSISAKTPEESCAQVFREARRAVPSVVYLPHLSEWWEAVSDTLKSTFLTLLQDLPPFCPILILATSDTPYLQLPEEVRGIFRSRYDEVVNLRRPEEEDRRRFFRELLLVEAIRAPPTCSRAGGRVLEALLPVEEEPRRLSEEEQRRLEEGEESTLRELRLFLRDVTKRLATDKRFSLFSKPVDIEEVSDYLEDFLSDIDLICSNALEYNPDKDPGDKIIRHRACSLKDTAHAMFASEMDVEFSRMCEEIQEARRRRDVLEAEPQQAPPPGAPAPARVAGEEHAGNVQGEGPEPPASKSPNHMKRKARRRPSWGRGIIRKKKSYKKEEELEEEAGPEEAAAPSDAGLTQDEDSSSDALDPPPPAQNGHAPLSTEEESSNEPPGPAPTPGPASAKLEAPPPWPQANGDVSLDSLEGEEPGPDPTPPTHTGGAPEGRGRELRPGEASDKEGLCGVERRSLSEPTPAVLQGEGTEDPPVPPLVVDHQRLQGLLEQVVGRTELYSVEQLERLFSLLSQVIYQHRRDYDKTRMIEEMERTVRRLDTFL
ncbi:hypothetical protein COCON_G00100230 [Conger conger]|uniref:AAA+ ATPase domain-containing protein n=1 Tax=Conger conger TaxID=82655 RepID=A0A9Q1DMP5_CONCO|nr:hypothetical protein COCON_G00100230 [Conger conger]